MPNGRDITGERQPIRGRSTGVIENRNIPSYSGVGNRGNGRGITDVPRETPALQSELQRISDLIRQNIPPLIAVPWNERFAGNIPNIPSDSPIQNIPRNPFEVLADSIQKLFGGSVYNPPLQQQSYGYGATSGINWSVIVILGAIGFGVYLYFKNQ